MHVWERKEERKGTLTVPLVCQQAPGFTRSIFNAVICYTELKMITEGLFSPSPPLFLFRFIRLSFPIKTALLEFLTFTLSVRNVYLNQKKGENGKNKNQPLRKSSSFLSLSPSLSLKNVTHTLHLQYSSVPFATPLFGCPLSPPTPHGHTHTVCCWNSSSTTEARTGARQDWVIQ